MSINRSDFIKYMSSGLQENLLKIQKTLENINERLESLDKKLNIEFEHMKSVDENICRQIDCIKILTNKK